MKLANKLSALHMGSFDLIMRTRLNSFLKVMNNIHLTLRCNTLKKETILEKEIT
jgi:hypothetical protein